VKNPRLFRVAALVPLTVVSSALPLHAASHVAGAMAPAVTTTLIGSDFATSLSGTIPGRNQGASRTVQLEVRRSSDDKVVQLAIEVSNSAGTAGSTYTFSVPATDLVVGSSSASLDTHQDLGTYGHISVQWTMPHQADQIEIPGNPCYGTAATTATHLVASATARLDLSLPCEGVVNATLSDADLDLYSGQDVDLPQSNPSADQSIYYTSVTATKSLAAGKGLVVNATKSSKAARITLSVNSSSTAEMGLTGSSEFAGDTLPLAGLSTGTNHAGQPATTLTYHGTLGSVSLDFTGAGEAITASDPGRCVNPNAAKADLSKMVGEQQTRAAVEGSVNLTAAATCSALQTTFGAGDRGMVFVFGPPSLSSSAAPPGTSDVLPAQGKGDVPDIEAISPAPGSSLAAARSITVTFARPLPAQAYLVIMLKGPSGAVALSEPVVSASSATVTIGSSAALQPGTYTLDVSATSGSGGQVFYEGTYTVSAPPSTGGTPPVEKHALPGVIDTGDFPTVVDISPPGGSVIGTTPTFVVTFMKDLAADVQIQVTLGPSDSQGNPTGIAQTSDPVVKGSTVSVSVPTSSPLGPGRYVFIIQGSDSGGLLEYRAMYTVK